MQVAIFFGSKSDTEVMKGAANALKEFGIEYKAFVLSAHRVPEKLEETLEEIERAAAKYPDRNSALMPALWAAQQECGHLSPDVIEAVAAAVGVSRAKAQGLATYHSLYWKKPVGKYVLMLCTNVACTLMGAETVLGDLRDPASLLAACRGVDTVITTANTILHQQPGDSIPVTDQQGQVDLVKAAKEAGVRHFILVSIPKDMEPSPLTTGKRTVEKAMQASGMTYTILGGGVFMEVWLSPPLGFDYPNFKATIYGDGHSQIRYIALGDVARCVVESLDNPAARNAFIEIGHPQTHSLLEVVHTFEKVGGKPFELQFVPEAALAAQKAAATDPLQISFAALTLNMAKGINFDVSQANKVFSFPLVPLEDYARRVMAVPA